MRRFAFSVLAFASLAAPASARAPGDVDTARQAVVRRCAEIYHSSGHPCACPTDPMRNGAACGGRSAHDRAGGASPVCSVDEVTSDLLANPAAVQERCHYHGR